MNGQLNAGDKMVTYKTVCNGNQCCQVMVDDNGIETILSCTANWPNTRMD